MALVLDFRNYYCDGDALMSEEFYKSEAEYWQEEAQRLKDLLVAIANQAWHRDYTIAPPEPPVGTRYFHDGKVTWTHADKGWVCNNSGCSHCPATWEEAWEHGINRTDVRSLPSD
jgi:hypothetical protein